MKKWTAPVLRRIGDLSVIQQGAAKLSGVLDGMNPNSNRKPD